MCVRERDRDRERARARDVPNVLPIVGPVVCPRALCVSGIDGPESEARKTTV